MTTPTRTIEYHKEPVSKEVEDFIPTFLAAIKRDREMLERSYEQGEAVEAAAAEHAECAEHAEERASGDEGDPLEEE